MSVKTCRAEFILGDPALPSDPPQHVLLMEQLAAILITNKNNGKLSKVNVVYTVEALETQP